MEERMVSELIKGRRLRPLRFTSLSSVPEKMRMLAIEEGEMLLEEPMDELPLSLYRAFSRTGSRAVYETPYFRKRRRLSHLVIAELLEGNGRFMDRIEDEIWSLLGEPSWVLPAHNTYVRDTPQLPVPAPISSVPVWIPAPASPPTAASTKPSKPVKTAPKPTTPGKKPRPNGTPTPNPTGEKK